MHYRFSFGIDLDSKNPVEISTLGDIAITA
jgi:hypothetical protein